LQEQVDQLKIFWAHYVQSGITLNTLQGKNLIILLVYNHLCFLHRIMYETIETDFFHLLLTICMYVSLVKKSLISKQVTTLPRVFGTTCEAHAIFY